MISTEPEKVDRFMQLLSENQSRLYGYIVALVCDLEDAHDVFQQASLIMWQKFETFEQGSNFLGWACSVARFEAMNFLRAQRRRVRLGDALLDELADTMEQADDLATSDRQEALVGCLEKLPPAERRILDDCYARGTAVKLVAAQLGRSSQSVCNSLRRIRLKLIECIDISLRNSLP